MLGKSVKDKTLLNIAQDKEMKVKGAKEKGLNLKLTQVN